MRIGIRLLLKADPDIEVIGSAANGDDATPGPHCEPPDVVRMVAHASTHYGRYPVIGPGTTMLGRPNHNVITLELNVADTVVKSHVPCSMVSAGVVRRTKADYRAADAGLLSLDGREPSATELQR